MIIDPSADDRLDRAFMALADPVRRRIIARLSRGPATVNELAEPFADHQAGGLQAHPGARAGRTRHAYARRPASARAPGCRPTRSPHRMDRSLPTDPRAAVPQPGRTARHHQRRRRRDQQKPTPRPAPHRKQRNHDHHTPSPSPPPRALPFIEIVREFDAPVEAVFRAHRDPELVKQWLGPQRLRDGHRALGLHVPGRLPLRAPQPRGRGVRVQRHLPHRARERVRRADLRVRGRARRGRDRVDDVRGPRRRAARASTSTRRIRRSRPATAWSPRGMEGGLREGYERLDAVLDA